MNKLESVIEARKMVESHWPQQPLPVACEHKNSKCVYESEDGEFERWQCQDCGFRFGVEIPQ